MDFPSFPGKTKDSVSVKKMMASQGNWTYKKEVLGWLIDTETGTVALPELKHLEILQLLSITARQGRIGRKELERLVGKLRAMHLVGPGVVERFYHIHSALKQRGKYRDWLLAYHH